MQPLQRLEADYPWVQTPLIIGAPMRLIALGELAVEISKAGGLGFIGAGTEASSLSTYLAHAAALLSRLSNPPKTRNNTLPLGIGFINWGVDPDAILDVLAQYQPAALWFFAPSSPDSLAEWSQKCRAASPHSRIWVQVGSVQGARDAVRTAKPDVLVVQGTDAGGHGLVRGAGLVALLPEVCDYIGTLGREEEQPVVIGAGGVADGRGAAAALVLGAAGVVMGTRFLAAREAVLSGGYQREVLRACDGGQATVRTKVWDICRGTTGWDALHNGRGVVNQTWVDAQAGMSDEENKRLYEEAMKEGDREFGIDGRLCTYAGSAVGLVKEVRGAGEIVEEVREGAKKAFERVGERF